MTTKKTNLLYKSVLFLAVFTFISLSKSTLLISDAAELVISRFETADLDTQKISSYDISMPEASSENLAMAGSTGTEPSSLSFDNDISTYSIIGNDERERITNTKTIPFRYIAYIRTTWPNGEQTLGTAWLCGPSAMMTSAHCVYNASRGGYARSIRVWPGKNGSVFPFDSYAIKSVHITREWKLTSDQNYDFALMNLKTAIGIKLGYFGVRYAKGATTYTGKHIAVAGYPGEYQGQLWKMSGSVSQSTDSLLYYKIDTTAGQSGSPVYRKDSSEFYAIGIHGYGSSEKNIGVRITRKIFYWIKNKR